MIERNTYNKQNDKSICYHRLCERGKNKKK